MPLDSYEIPCPYCGNWIMEDDEQCYRCDAILPSRETPEETRK